MPELETVSVSYSRKLQLEQFEPVEHFVELEVAVEEGDDPEEVYDEYSGLAEGMVERALAARTAAKQFESDDE